jgi:protein-S-isoprenylcysteine O-methyltransferase Ste14
MYEDYWPVIFLISLGISILINHKMITVSYDKKAEKERGKTVGFGTAILMILARGLVFFVLIILPLIDQPRIPGGIMIPAIGFVVLAFGLGLTYVSTRELGKTKFHSGLKGIPEKIITTGPYSVIRHPATVGFNSIYAGWALCWAAAYALCLVPVFFVLLYFETSWEERNLEKELGEEYRDYKRKVGKFIPRMTGT